MMSYFNHHHPMPVYSKGNPGSLPYDPTGWYSSGYAGTHTANPQYLSAGNGSGDNDASAMYHSHHPHHPMFHRSNADWGVHDGYGTPQSSPLIPSVFGPSAGQTTPHASHLGQTNGGGVIDGSMDHHMNDDGITNVPPSPPNSGCSEMSSPGIGNGGSAAGGMHGDDSLMAAITPRPANIKSPFEWMKKPSHQNHPQPG